MATVLLFADAQGIGKKGDIVSVKDGYASNFIIPKKLGRIATGEDVKFYETSKDEVKSKGTKKASIAAKIAGMPQISLVKLAVPVEVQTASGGKVYGTITDSMIIDSAIANFPLLKNFDKSELSVVLHQKIENAGKYAVEVNITLKENNGVQKFKFSLYVDIVSISEAKRKSK